MEKNPISSAAKFGMMRDEDAWGAKMGSVQENPPAPTEGGLSSRVQYCVQLRSSLPSTA